MSEDRQKFFKNKGRDQAVSGLGVWLWVWLGGCGLINVLLILLGDEAKEDAGHCGAKKSKQE